MSTIHLCVYIISSIYEISPLISTGLRFVTNIINMLILITIKNKTSSFLLSSNDAQKAINNSESYTEDKKWL